jgi:hypothetical protein
LTIILEDQPKVPWLTLHQTLQSYKATHVDDIAIAATRPAEYTMYSMIEQEFLVWNKEESPSNYLGNDLKMRGEEWLHVSNKTYIKEEVLRKYHEEHQTFPKKNTPMSQNAHPELDLTDLLDEPRIRHSKKIIGI